MMGRLLGHRKVLMHWESNQPFNY